MDWTTSQNSLDLSHLTRRAPGLPRLLEHRDLYNDVDATSRGVIFALACLIGISTWNAGEIIVVVWRTFKGRFRTLYFWSIFSTALGILISSASQAYIFGPATRNPIIAQGVGSAGWVPTVTGQSLVLYSRLHLLWVNRRLLRLILCLIVFNALGLHIPDVVLGILASVSRSRYVAAYELMEKIEVTVFFVQEASLSGVYLWQARHFQRKYGRRSHGDGGAVKGMLRDLVVVNVVVVMLDISILVLQFMGLFFIQVVAKTFVYSCKLKLELNVLNQLREFVRRTRDFDTSYVERERRWEQNKIQMQWESALRRAFGSVGGTQTRDPDLEAHVAEGRQTVSVALQSQKSTTRQVLVPPQASEGQSNPGGSGGIGEIQPPDQKT